MLSKRQMMILVELNNRSGEWMKANYFANTFNVSLRTIQNDIKAIKEYAQENEDSFIVETKVPFGTRLIVTNTDSFYQSFEDLKKQTDINSLNYREDRIEKLLHFLFYQHKSISLNKCAEAVFVSKSTLIGDLKEMEKLLDKYSLRLIQSKGYVYVDGLERDKRICLMENNAYHLKLLKKSDVHVSYSEQLEYLHNILLKELLKRRYPISDVEFQNVVLWLNISIKRIQKFFYLNEDDIDQTHPVETELSIAKEVFAQIEKHFLIRGPQTEIDFLALYINNHGNYSNTDYISEDLNNFIVDALEKIHTMYPTDFTHDVNLRISLAMHCVPLISRARNNVQVKNEMLDYIKQSYPYAFDIATYFSYLLSKQYSIQIKEEETAFLAIYFNKSVMESAAFRGSKRICIITNLKRSEYFLLEQYLYDQFQKYIVSITFVTSEELDDLDLDEYDLFFSTEDNRATESGLAMKISSFPDTNELEMMKVRIEGFRNADDIVDLFDSRLFYVHDFKKKENIQNWLVNKAMELYHCPELQNEIELREQFGSTYFGNSIAILHPMHFSGEASFIGEVILKKPVVWDREGNHVNIVFLVCIQHNNLEAFRAWEYLSPLLFNNNLKQKMVTSKSFDEFLRVCKEDLELSLK
ncbi:BglG family transcription antiterminator [Catenisphaera adipataccumulans]|uniref:Lichenan operon transcriptional antiterminator n=1 Tax=Catenisphaera adipataccumulans TaxID=700500 RepID=A0A7W8CZE6_9FIRM|nr:PRD domain-containing protein [Catenisphaera adipataccumulans]MBB5182780.1 lichenan operon transcriptional antiterminator [Catenisphaera adipataccumulans]